MEKKSPVAADFGLDERATTPTSDGQCGKGVGTCTNCCSPAGWDDLGICKENFILMDISDGVVALRNTAQLPIANSNTVLYAMRILFHLVLQPPQSLGLCLDLSHMVGWEFTIALCLGVG